MSIEVHERCIRCGKFTVSEKINITVAEYAELHRKAELFDQSQTGLNHFLSVSKSPIARNPEMADLLIEMSPHSELKDMVVECKKRYGENAPSRTAIHRFLSAVKDHLKSV